MTRLLPRRLWGGEAADASVEEDARRFFGSDGMSPAVPGDEVADPPEAELDSDGMSDADPADSDDGLSVPAERRNLKAEAVSPRHSPQRPHEQSSAGCN